MLHPPSCSKAAKRITSFLFPLNFNPLLRGHSVRDQPGPELLTPDHCPVGARGRVAVPSARWVSDSQLSRGPAALLPHRPSHLMLPQHAPAEAQSHVVTDSRPARSHFPFHSKRRSERENAYADDLMCSTSGHVVSWRRFSTPGPAVVGLRQCLRLCLWN